MTLWIEIWLWFIIAILLWIGWMIAIVFDKKDNKRKVERGKSK